VDFAVLALFTATSLFFGNISTLQYDQAIMLPRERKDAVNLLFLSIFCVLCTTILVFLVVTLCKPFLVKLMDNDRIGDWLILIPLSVLLTGSYRSLNMWASRQKLFKRLALRNISQTSTASGVKLLTGFLKYSNGGLIVGSLAGQLVATTIMARETKVKDNIDVRQISHKRMFSNAKRYKEFPIYTNWQSLTSMIDNTGSKYIISNFFGAAVLGWYSFTFSLLLRPLQLIGSSVSQVFYQNISDKYNNNKELWPTVRKVIFRLLLLSLPIYIPLILWGKEIFAFVFGKMWQDAGIYAQIMVPWLFAKSLFSPISTIPIVLKKQKQLFMLTLILNLMIPAGFFAGSVLSNDFESILFLVSVLGFVYVGFMIFWIRHITINLKYDNQQN
jgi:O-antigen/teichoic acid export membrane protein